MKPQTPEIEARNRILKIAFGGIALMSLLAGLIIYLFAESFGLDEDTTRFVAIAFLVVGAGDYLILRLWERKMKRH